MDSKGGSNLIFQTNSNKIWFLFHLLFCVSFWENSIPIDIKVLYCIVLYALICSHMLSVGIALQIYWWEITAVFNENLLSLRLDSTLLYLLMETQKSWKQLSLSLSPIICLLLELWWFHVFWGIVVILCYSYGW